MRVCFIKKIIRRMYTLKKSLETWLDIPCSDIRYSRIKHWSRVWNLPSRIWASMVVTSIKCIVCYKCCLWSYAWLGSWDSQGWLSFLSNNIWSCRTYLLSFLLLLFLIIIIFCKFSFGFVIQGMWVSMGVYSDGSYGIPKDIIYSFLVKCENGKWSIVMGKLCGFYML